MATSRPAAYLIANKSWMLGNPVSVCLGAGDRQAGTVIRLNPDCGQHGRVGVPWESTRFFCGTHFNLLLKNTATSQEARPSS